MNTVQVGTGREIDQIISRLNELISGNKSVSERIHQLGHRLQPIPTEPKCDEKSTDRCVKQNSGGYLEEINNSITSLYQLCRDMEQEINRIENLA